MPGATVSLNSVLLIPGVVYCVSQLPETQHGIAGECFGSLSSDLCFLFAVSLLAATRVLAHAFNMEIWVW